MPLALFLLVIALHLWLVWVAPFPGDRWALRQAWTPHPTWVRDYANFFQHLATPLVAIALVAVALILILRHASLAEAAGLVVACLAVPLNAILKLVLGASPLWRTAACTSSTIIARRAWRRGTARSRLARARWRSR